MTLPPLLALAGIALLIVSAVLDLRDASWRASVAAAEHQAAVNQKLELEQSREREEVLSRKVVVLKENLAMLLAVSVRATTPPASPRPPK